MKKDEYEMKQYIGHRVLISREVWDNDLHEVTIVEVSKSGDFVKVRYDERTKWEKAVSLDILEDLGVVK